MPSFSFTLHGAISNYYFPVAILCFVSLCRYFWTALSSVRYKSLLVHCIHQEEGCDWKDKLLYDVQISHDVYPLRALMAREVPVGLICSRETLKSGHSWGKKYIEAFLPYTLSSCHESAKVALREFLSCLAAIDSNMVHPPISAIGFTVQIEPLWCPCFYQLDYLRNT